jgi:hypothetical protein
MTANLFPIAGLFGGIETGLLLFIPQKITVDPLQKAPENT